MTCMKTTIDLPDSLAAEMKRLAAREGITMRELIIEGLRGEIERRQQARPRADFVFTTVDGDGLSPDVDPMMLTRLAYDLP